jgi:hypothetical protein
MNTFGTQNKIKEDGRYKDDCDGLGITSCRGKKEYGREVVRTFWKTN